MQRREIAKISIFSSLDIIFNCLMSRVESRCSTQVFKSSQDVNMKTQLDDQFISFDKKDCSNQQSYSCLALKFHEDINKHLLF